MNNFKHPLNNIIKSQKNGVPKGIYSICSANEYVIEVALKYALQKKINVLIESTCNQVNQFGGYIGMKPLDFANFIFSIADTVKFPKNKIILGGDHLGPNPWKKETSQNAMEKACSMVKEYALAGFSKIHLDASMCLADDSEEKDGTLNSEIIAEREAKLCFEAEKAYKNIFDSDKLLPVYVIGSEVPAPGGTKEAKENSEITSSFNLKNTIELTKKAFYDLNLENAWERVIAVVVNLGIEFNNKKIFKYNRESVQGLFRVIKQYPNLAIEAHSTDYQPRSALKNMVKDGVAILKVGPALTFVFREALFALCYVEKELFFNTSEVQSNLIEVMEEAMLENPKYWVDYYEGTDEEKRLMRKYSFLDRSRYYWNVSEVKKAVEILFENLKKKKIPLTLVSQFMPVQYQKIRDGIIKDDPKELVRDNIVNVLNKYYSAI
jgi:D-tagatose-1,6-bisphosphate aldolase subunit GatZ/KbaZ